MEPPRRCSGRRRVGRCRDGAAPAGQVTAPPPRAETAIAAAATTRHGCRHAGFAALIAGMSLDRLHDPPQATKIDQERPAGRIVERVRQLLWIEEARRRETPK